MFGVEFYSTPLDDFWKYIHLYFIRRQESEIMEISFPDF